jgi:hypothetical protein
MNQLYKYYTEGENWAKIQADKINLISGDMASQGAQIEINKNAIDIRVKKDEVINAINVSTEGIKLAGSKVQVTGTDGIRLTAGLMYDKDLKEILDDSYSRIDLAENEIDLRVTKAGVINAVNVSTEGIKLMGTKVEITGPTGIIAQGNLAVGNLSALNATIENLRSGTASFSYILGIGGATINGLLQVGSIETGKIINTGQYFGGKIYGSSLYEGSVSLEDKYLGKTAKAADSNRLNGELASFYALKSVTDGQATAILNNANAIVAHGTLISGKLGVSAKAADSDLLDGYHYDAFSYCMPMA